MDLFWRSSDCGQHSKATQTAPPDEQMGGQEEKAEEAAIQSVDAPRSRGGGEERRGNGYLKPV